MLGWAEEGDPSGPTVLFFQGAPASRLPLCPRQGEVASALGVRLITVERPGYGVSTRHPARTLLGWADDVAALANALGLERFAIIGFSAGGPHALACAAQLGERVTRVVVVGCGGPWDLPELARHMDWPRRVLRLLGRRAPGLLRFVYGRFARLRRDPEKLLLRMLAGLSAPDQEVIRRPEILRVAATQTAAALAPGLDGMADEVLLLAQPWGFDLSTITVPVTLYCGTLDSAAPLVQAQYLAAHLLRAELHRLEGEGHLCIIPHWDEILAAARA
jgi:pimeloyl-ACP methyl ester carboxylesterase